MMSLFQSKTNIFCCFVDFRKYFDIVPKKNLWYRLEEIKVPFELRVVGIRLYEKIISKWKKIDGWLKEINYNIGVKQGYPLYPTIFCIYIDRLEECLEGAGCVSPTLTIIRINVILYDDDIILRARIPNDLGEKLKFLKDVFSNMGMTINIEKKKLLIPSLDMG
jgi:hypothetical protein